MTTTMTEVNAVSNGVAACGVSDVGSCRGR